MAGHRATLDSIGETVGVVVGALFFGVVMMGFSLLFLSGLRAVVHYLIY